MEQIELFEREDREYALSLSLGELREMHTTNPILAEYLYELRRTERDRIKYQVVRATFIAKFDGSEFSRLKPY
jgi:hypothetical protein